MFPDWVDQRAFATNPCSIFRQKLDLGRVGRCPIQKSSKQLIMMKKKAITKSLKDRLKRIRMLVLDVDGVLTDCRVFMEKDGEWRRFFSIRDGYGIQLLHAAGIKTAVITGSKARDIQERVRHLSIDFFYEGHLDKLPMLQELSETSGISFDEMAYVGDDDFDVPLLERVGFAATVPDAMESALDVVHYVTERPGGNGAVREVCELLINHSATAKRKETSSTQAKATTKRRPVAGQSQR